MDWQTFLISQKGWRDDEGNTLCFSDCDLNGKKKRGRTLDLSGRGASLRRHASSHSRQLGGSKRCAFGLPKGYTLANG